MSQFLSSVLEMFALCVRGIPVTLLITAVTLMISLPLGFITAVVRTGSKHRVLKAILNVYVSFERGCPPIVQIMLVYILLPNQLDRLFGFLRVPFLASSINNLFYAFLVFSLLMTAFLSETFRSGLGSVDRGQYEAAVCSGLTGFQAYRRIVAPQVFSAALPVLCTNVNNLIKMTSLSFAMSILEITGISKVRAGQNFNYIEAYVTILIIYVVLCMAVELLFKFLEKRSRKTSERRVAPRSRGPAEVSSC